LHFHLDLIQTVGLAILVLFIGYFFNRRVSFLRENNIPEPVVGGMAFAVLTAILYIYFDFQLSFDMSLKSPLMLTFFTTVGLGASFRLLVVGGPKVLLFLALASAYLVIQNAVGVGLALATDLHPTFGLIGGSITLAGGHGTGATWAEAFSKTQNLRGAMELAMACATFGLVLGGLIGGPVAQRLITRNNLKSEEGATTPEEGATDPEAPITYDPEEADQVTPLKVLETLFIICVCIVSGDFIVTFLKSHEIIVPTFICALMTGIVITNVCELTGIYQINKQCVDLLGTLGLSLFLSMSLMSLRLWELTNLAGPMMLIMLVQTLTLAAFCYFITFRVMGANYDAAIIAGGHCGFGMGATPTAVANMEALTSRFGPSSNAYLVVTMVGAFFIDIANALVIQFYLSLPAFQI
jgi:ESS family glutamate:Na+ symporter